MTTAPRSYHFTLVTGPVGHLRWVKNALLLLSGAAAAATYAAYVRRQRRRKKIHASALSEAFVGAGVLESRVAVDQLLGFHYGHPADVLPALFETEQQRGVLNFCQQLSVAVERHCDALKDFTGDIDEPTALDIGCGVGGISFELARSFPHVIGVDASTACINAAKTMKERGWMRYASVEEGELTLEKTATMPDVNARRVHFVVADPSALPANLSGPYDAVVAANVLCRLQNPIALLEKLPSLVRPGGIAVLASPYDWIESCTPRAKWLGGYRDVEGHEVKTIDGLKRVLGTGFELIYDQDLPIFVRQSARKYTFYSSALTVWKRT